MRPHVAVLFAVALFVGAAACRGSSPLAARSSAGALTLTRFERDWPKDARVTPDARRRAGEEWLV